MGDFPENAQDISMNKRIDFYLDWVRKSAIYFFNVFGKNTGEMKKNLVGLNVCPENE